MSTFFSNVLFKEIVSLNFFLAFLDLYKRWGLSSETTNTNWVSQSDHHITQSTRRCHIQTKKMLFQKLSFVFALCVLTDCAYINLPGQPFDFQCPAGQVISRVSSVYDVLLEDRQWEFGCRTENVTQTCSTSGRYSNALSLF